ncbi:MAG TPA: DUF305 domain-containing protein [Leptolyngbyaceae cyanobacterium]
MDRRALIYGSVLAGSSAAFLIWISTFNHTQAQTQVLVQNPTQTQTQPPTSEHNTHHPNSSPNVAPAAMGMMNPQQADLHFIEMMIPHHQGAINMANLALSKTNRLEIKKLAQAIKTDQNREIEQMKTWYKQWYGTEIPASSGMEMMSIQSGTSMARGENQQMPMNACMEMMGMNMKSGTGMMSMNMMGTDLDALKNAPDFDKAFIGQMIPHHKMAVMMAGMVLDSDRPEIRNLAKNIIQSQSIEIEQMRQWNQTWFR